MLGKKICAAAVALWLVFGAGNLSAKGENSPFFRHSEIRKTAYASGRIYNSQVSPRPWWGVLYKDALLLARMDEDETEDSVETEAEESPDTVEFVWPVLTWLLSLLGL